MFLDLQRCHHKPGVGSLLQMLGLGHDPPLTAPGVQGLILQLREDAGRLLGCFVLLPSLLQLLGDQLEQPWILGQPEEVIHAVGLTPCHDRIATESAVATDDDLHLGPSLADLRDNPLNLLQGSGTGIDVGWPEPGT